jgi:type II secretory pathway predicted ATPase ExeA
MHNLALGLSVAPFDADFDPRFFYRGFQHSAALSFLDRSVQGGDNLFVLSGAAGTGKTACIDFFLRENRHTVRGGCITQPAAEGAEFLADVLEAFGFGQVEAEHRELKNLLSVFLVQVAQDGQRALLQIGDPRAISDEVTRELLWLAEVAGKESPLNIVITGDMDLERLLESRRLKPLLDRLRLRHRLDPLSARETHDYLHFRLAAAGCGRPSALMPPAVGMAIYAATGGVPARINQLATAVLETVEKDHAPAPSVDDVRVCAARLGLSGGEALGYNCRLEISRDNATFLEVPLGRDKMLVGRHSFNDICLRDSSVSRHHALIVPDGSAWVVVDLGSTNGTTVNGQTVRQRTLADRDEIKVGRFLIVFRGGPPGVPAQPPEESDFRTTVVFGKEGPEVS